MKFEIYGSISASVSETVEAKDEAEAGKIAYNRMLEEKKKAFAATVNFNIRESDENWTYHTGGIYLMKFYTKQMPAVCILSAKRYAWRSKGKEFEHTFQYLEKKNKYGNDGYFTVRNLAGDPTPRMLKELCEDGVIREEKCRNCVARFTCFTKKES